MSVPGAERKPLCQIRPCKAVLIRVGAVGLFSTRRQLRPKCSFGAFVCTAELWQRGSKGPGLMQPGVLNVSNLETEANLAGQNAGPEKATSLREFDENANQTEPGAKQ